MPPRLARHVTYWASSLRSESISFWAYGYNRGNGLRPSNPNRLSRTRSVATLAGTKEEEIDQNGTLKHARANGTWGPVPRRTKPNTKNIIVTDLEATVEAHRVANTAKIIRHIACGTDAGQFIRLKLPRAETKIVRRQLHAKDPVISASQDSDVQRSSQLTREQESADTREHISTSLAPRRRLSAREPQGAWANRESRHIGYIDNTSHPWLDHVQKDEDDALLRLDEEIRALERYMMPTPEEEASVDRLIAHVKELVGAVAPSNEVIVHGSRYTKLATPLSDIDFCVSLPEYDKTSGESGLRLSHPRAKRGRAHLLKIIMGAMKNISRLGTVKLIHARVDLVACVDATTGLALQFSTLAPYLPAREYTMYYLAEFPSLRPLYILLRHSLLIRDLTTVHEGGLGSYPLLIMIVTALKHSRLTFGREELGRQLLHVLKFWSCANLRQHGYCADPPRIFTKADFKVWPDDIVERSTDQFLKGIDTIRKSRIKLGKQIIEQRKSEIKQPGLLCLQDPGNPENDLGKNARQIQEIQDLFTQTYRHLKSSIYRWKESAEAGRQKQNLHYAFLDPLVKADYYHFERDRKNVRRGQIRPRFPATQQTHGVPEQQNLRLEISQQADQPVSLTSMTGLQLGYGETDQSNVTNSESQPSP